MPADNEIPLEFPLQGLNVTREYQLQPPGTTPAAVNVRAIDTLDERLRGGSRSGLSKLIASTVNGNAPIQNLSVLVTADEDAVNTDYASSDERSWSSTNPDDDVTTDPSTNNNAAGRGNRNPTRVVRTGGSGRRSVKADPASPFCRTYHVAAAFSESYNDFDICTTDTFPYDFSAESGGSGQGLTLVAPGPSPPSLSQVNAIIVTAGGPSGVYDDFTDA